MPKKTEIEKTRKIGLACAQFYKVNYLAVERGIQSMNYHREVAI